MNIRTGLIIYLLAVASSSTVAAAAPLGSGARTSAEIATTRAEAQIRNLLDPLLQKYCHDECKLLAVKATADLSVPDDVAPGFEDTDPASASRIEPSSAQIRLLVDEKLGPVSRRKLLDLLQQYLDTLDFPVKVDTQLAYFPEPAVAAGKVAELREKVEKKFRDTIETLLAQFCPNSCMLADFGLKTETVNLEEAQYGSSGEYFSEAGVAIRVKDLSATLLMDDSLAPIEQSNILEMAKLKTGEFKNVTLAAKPLHFPRPGAVEVDAQGHPLALGVNGVRRGLASTNSSSSEKNDRTDHSESNSKSQSDSRYQQNTEDRRTSSQTANSNTTNDEKNERQEHYERFEKIERVENGDAVQEQLKKFQTYALFFGAGVLALLIFIAFSTLRSRGGGWAGLGEKFGLPFGGNGGADHGLPGSDEPSTSNLQERTQKMGIRLDGDRLRDELMEVFAQQPKVAKYVFTRILQEEGVEITAAYVHLFGESVVIDLLRDPSLQGDVNELTEYYARTPLEINDEEKLELLKKLQARTVSGKLSVMGRRSTNQFDFLVDMDGLQIFELVRNESMTVKAIILTQCDNSKRGQIFTQLEEAARMQLLAELSRIDYLPRDYITNVANALRRKRNENPKLNTEALPGSEVLVNLLERAPSETQLSLLKNLERANPDSARTLKNKLVSVNTLRYLRDSQLLEVVLSLKHDELLHFLKGSVAEVRNHVLTKTPRDLAEELMDELKGSQATSREQYAIVERKILNRMKVMANEGLINLAETNERMFAEFDQGPRAVAGGAKQSPKPPPSPETTRTAGPVDVSSIRRASGW